MAKTKICEPCKSPPWKRAIKQLHEPVACVASARLPTKFGLFQVVAFTHGDDKEHAALVKGNVRGKTGVLVRVHSECLTGDAFGSEKCDCRAQLETAEKRIAKSKAGVLVYLRQEGRGIGLVNKIRAYELQDRGLDTVEANRALGFDDDLRVYNTAARMLKILGVKSIDLLTNNPAKVRELENAGIVVRRRVPLITPPTKYNRRYIEVKKEKMGHKF